jgi:hypothetical protein
MGLRSVNWRAPLGRWRFDRSHTPQVGARRPGVKPPVAVCCQLNAPVLPFPGLSVVSGYTLYLFSTLADDLPACIQKSWIDASSVPLILREAELSHSYSAHLQGAQQ